MEIIALSASASASATLPACSSRRTSGTAPAAAGLTRFIFCPAQTESSLSCSRSSRTPPKTIAPSRPLPMGSASFQRAAGVRYRQQDCACGAAGTFCGGWAEPSTLTRRRATRVGLCIGAKATSFQLSATSPPSRFHLRPSGYGGQVGEAGPARRLADLPTADPLTPNPRTANPRPMR